MTSFRSGCFIDYVHSQTSLDNKWIFAKGVRFLQSDKPLDLVFFTSKFPCIFLFLRFSTINLLAILQKSLDRALFLYNFIRKVRSSGVRASITIVHIRKFLRMHHNIVRFRFFPRIAKRPITVGNKVSDLQSLFEL